MIRVVKPFLLMTGKVTHSFPSRNAYLYSKFGDDGEVFWAVDFDGAAGRFEFGIGGAIFRDGAGGSRHKDSRRRGGL
jgi:hypothetical protein